MYSRCETVNDWSNFWKEWRNHDLKAHRAFFYEFFSLLRLELEFENQHSNTFSLRESFSKEKEASFYVDINKETRKIHKPELEISDDECVRRVASLVGLFNAVFHIKDWLIGNYPQEFKNAISDYAHKTISEQVHQQDVLQVLDKMKGNSEDYNDGLDKIKELFTKQTPIEN